MSYEPIPLWFAIASMGCVLAAAIAISELWFAASRWWDWLKRGDFER